MTDFPDDVDGRRLCSSCKEWKPAALAFYVDKRQGAPYRRCKECHLALQPKHPRYPPDTETERYCSGHWKMEPLTEFYVDSRNGLPWRRCKAIQGRDNVRSRNRTPETKRKHQRANNLRRYGLTVGQYEEMIEGQGGLCPICGTDITEPDAIGRPAPVDHCHATGRNRKILCWGCNSGLGMFRDNPAALRAAADYIEGHSQP